MSLRSSTRKEMARNTETGLSANAASRGGDSHEEPEPPEPCPDLKGACLPRTARTFSALLENEVTKFLFQVKAGGSLQTAMLRFASKAEIQRYHRSLAPFVRQAPTIIREAVEFTRLAAKRWRYYASSGEAAESLANLRQRFAAIQSVKWHSSSWPRFDVSATTRLSA